MSERRGFYNYEISGKRIFGLSSKTERFFQPMGKHSWHYLKLNIYETWLGEYVDVGNSGLQIYG